MYDKSRHKYYAKRYINRAYNYLMYYKRNVTTNGPYIDSFKNSFIYNIWDAIQHLNNLK